MFLLGLHVRNVSISVKFEFEELTPIPSDTRESRKINLVSLVNLKGRCMKDGCHAFLIKKKLLR